MAARKAWHGLLGCAAIFVLLPAAAVAADLNLGRVATPAEIAGWSIVSLLQNLASPVVLF